MRKSRPVWKLLLVLLCAAVVVGTVILRHSRSMPDVGSAVPDASPADETDPDDAAPAPSSTPAATPEPTPEPNTEPTPESTPEPTPEPEAESLEITASNRNGSYPVLCDGDYTSFFYFYRGSQITVTAQQDIYALYILWESEPLPGTVRCGDTETAFGEYGFVHELIRLPEPGREVSIHLNEGGDVQIAEIYALSKGSLPDWVQDWQPPCEKADVLFFPTHSDDEFIFMGGVIPSCVDRGMEVQVAYIVNNLGFRRHEMLDSLWEAGVRHYPVSSSREDLYVSSQDEAEKTYGRDYLTGYIVEQLRRFKPLVAVGHAEDGESGHPVHIFGVRCLKDALELSNVSGQYPESEEAYGLWDVPKAYLHLYGDPEAMTVLDYETPLEHFNGATAYEMACRAFEKCSTQIRKGKYEIYGSDSVFDTHRFGLYRSLVGPDQDRNDLFEHLSPSLYASALEEDEAPR